MSIRKKLQELSNAASDTSATHALLIWLDTLPEEILITAEGRRRSVSVGPVTEALPRYRPKPGEAETIEALVSTDATLARNYWEHPFMIWSDRSSR